MLAINHLLPSRHVALLELLSATAADEGCKLYLVGGLVRDLLMECALGEDLDIDISVEGDLDALLARLKAAAIPAIDTQFKLGRFDRFRKYGTAKLGFIHRQEDWQIGIDFARCRKEQYRDIAAKPEVSWTTIDEDLWRRDFSINAIACSLQPERYGVLHDPTAGVAALEEGRLDVLHEQSFVDDPCRLLRLVRFAHRFSFTPGETTAALEADAIKAAYLPRVAPQRRFDEFRKSINEPEWMAVIAACARRGLLEQIHPLVQKAYEQIIKNESENELAALADELSRLKGFFAALSRSAQEELCSALEVRKKYRKAICHES